MIGYEEGAMGYYVASFASVISLGSFIASIMVYSVCFVNDQFKSQLP